MSDGNILSNYLKLKIWMNQHYLQCWTFSGFCDSQCLLVYQVIHKITQKVTFSWNVDNGTRNRWSCSYTGNPPCKNEKIISECGRNHIQSRIIYIRMDIETAHQVHIRGRSGVNRVYCSVWSDNKGTVARSTGLTLENSKRGRDPYSSSISESFISIDVWVYS